MSASTFRKNQNILEIYEEGASAHESLNLGTDAEKSQYVFSTGDFGP